MTNWQAPSQKELLLIIHEFLINSLCSCGGWKCPRCIITVQDAKKVLPVCTTCDGDGQVSEDVAQAGDQTMTETYTCPDCSGLGV